MHFCSQQYLFFFCAILLVYWALPIHRLRVWLLLVASFYFYASWNHWLAVIICVSTVVDYWIARGLDATSSPRQRKALLSVSLIGNLGLLCYFKYANFFLNSLEEALRAVGAEASLPVLSVILPIGISFYTFEAINYTVDVFRGRAKAERDLSHFMLFILFFPHLVAGPIVRARDFLPQVNRRKRWSWGRAQLGSQYLIMGLFKKSVLADQMARFSDPVFAHPDLYSSSAVWLAMIAYALRIYGDFSGYTDMAIGSAHLLGYKLAQNFNMPYLAANVSEFWRRWHISLSSWLRDYLFIPLGGSRNDRRTNRNLLITMTLGGLWHGASWTFVVWGILHSLLLVIHRGFKSFCQSRAKLDEALQSMPGTALRIGLTFLSVCMCWVFFRATTFGEAATFLRRLAIPHDGLSVPLSPLSFWCLGTVVVIAHLLAQRDLWKKIVVHMPAPVLGFGYAAVVVLVLVLTPGTSQRFIYFQF